MLTLQNPFNAEIIIEGQPARCAVIGVRNDGYANWFVCLVDDDDGMTRLREAAEVRTIYRPG